MQIKPGNFCPLLKGDCVGIKCAWFTKVQGTNRNTGEMLDEWQCAVAWVPFMQIESAQQHRSSTAALESFRNEVVRGNQQNQRLYAEAIKQGVIPAIVTPMTGPSNLLDASGEVDPPLLPDPYSNE